MSWALRLLPALSQAYAAARGAGLLERRWFRRVYVRAYFAYKRHLEDPFEGLVGARPDLFQGGHILDVGAHIGYTASLFRQVITRGFRIYAFEPDPANLGILRETTREGGASDVIVPVAAAVGDRDGEADLWRNPMHPGDHRLATAAFREWVGKVEGTLPVRLWSIDGFLRAEKEDGPVAFVKIDTQGSEPAVCRGMEELLGRCPGVAVALEYAPRELEAQGFDPESLPQFFQARGRSVRVLAKAGSVEDVPLASLRGLALRGRGYLDLLVLPERT